MLGWAGWVFASCWWCCLGLLNCNLLWWTGEPCVEHVRGLRCLFEGMGPTRQLHTPKSSELGQYMQYVCIAQGRIGGFGEVVLELRSLSWWYYWCVGSTSGHQTGWFLDIFLEVCVLGYMPIDIVEMWWLRANAHHLAFWGIEPHPPCTRPFMKSGQIVL